MILGLTCVLVIGWFGVQRALQTGGHRTVAAWDDSVEIQLDPTKEIDDLAGTLVIPHDSTHILVPQKMSVAQPLLRPLYNRLDASILTSYYVDGLLPDIVPRAEVPPIDVVYLWVNSSGTVFSEAMVARAESEGIEVDTGDSKRYRDNGELRGAVRSAKSALNGLGTMHVLSGDYPIPAGYALPADSEEGEWKLGQIPEWLDWESVRDGSAGLKWHFHSRVYRIPVDDYDSPEDRMLDLEYEDEWRDMSVPSFNSFAIESRVGWMDGLAENL
jgi:3-O-alpha-D-mannopyranosyl-alpha-D-mannopyranose xylosylphosphotransferase